MEKLSCTECGALILPVTAASTGGICMACKQGIRQSMEASRAYYQSLKEYDPFRELWHSLVERCSKDATLKDFSDEERHYFSVSVLEGDVYNGGFDQYFYNSSGSYYKYAVSGLTALGASTSLKILLRASEQIFGKCAPPEDQLERWELMKKRERLLRWQPWQPSLSARLNKLDHEFWDDPDNLFDLLQGYAEAHSLVEPFKK